MSSGKGREEEVPVDLEGALLKASVWGFINGSKVLWEHQIFTSGILPVSLSLTLLYLTSDLPPALLFPIL